MPVGNVSPMTVIGVLGLGEAGGEIARNLVDAGAVVRGYDPKVAAPPGVVGCADEAEAASGADVVCNVNSSHDAETALRNALPGLRAPTVWAELNTSSAKAKQHLAAVVADAFGGEDTVRFADVAIMNPVPGTGVRTPMLAAGPGAKAFAEAIVPFGGRIEVLDEPVGAAATKKLLRSVFFKGMSMAVVEALAAARAAGLEDWLYPHIREQLVDFDARAIERIVDGSYRHARRRADEMEAASELLADLGVAPLVAGASQRSLAAIAAGGATRP